MNEKRLYRSRTNRMLCGVCGGLGEYFRIDPTLVRLVAALFCLCSCFTAALAYAVAALIIPEEGVQ